MRSLYILWVVLAAFCVNPDCFAQANEQQVDSLLVRLLDSSETLPLRNLAANKLMGQDLSQFSEELWEIYQAEEDVKFKLNMAGLLHTSDPFLAYQAYEELYKSCDGYCKQQSLKNLVLLRPEESYNWYISALQADDWITVNLAMDSLIATTKFSPGRLIRLFHRPDVSEVIRWRIVHVLANRAENEYLFLLLEGLSDPGWLVQNEAALALSRMPPNLVLPELSYHEQSSDKELVRRVGWVKKQFEGETSQELASMQPFDGYPMLDDVEKIKGVLSNKCVDTISFRKGEVIADIGAGNGYLEAMLSLFHDNLTFYIQDIDTTICNPKNIRDVVDFYQEVNGRDFTNRFITVNGTDTETNLPDNTFDKILMLWTYQYLKSPSGFIGNLRANLKNGGLFYVINPDQDYEKGKALALEYGWNVSTVEKQISDIISFGFELVGISRNYESDELPYMLVFRKK